jgi:hypothetical protein
LTAVIAVALGLLRFPTALGMTVAFSVMFSLLVAATLGALVTRDTTGAYCIGCAVAGWMHFLIAFTPWFQRGMDRVFISVYIVEQLAPVFGHKFAWNLNMNDSLIENALFNYSPGSPADDYFLYVVIGFSIFTIVAGLIGGSLGRYLFRRTNPALQN